MEDCRILVGELAFSGDFTSRREEMSLDLTTVILISSEVLRVGY